MTRVQPLKAVQRMEDSMAKIVTRGQALELAGRFGVDTNWDSVDGDKLQTEVISLPRDELGRRFTAFVNNGCRFIIKGPSALVVDRSKPFDPVKFIGRGWEIVEQDERSLALTDIDFSGVRFESGHQEGEDTITGEVKLERLKAMPEIRLDAKIGQALFEEPGQATLRFIHDHFNVSWFELGGTVLRNSDGRRVFLYLYRFGDGSWSWDCDWLDSDRRRVRDDVSPLLASSPVASAA